VLSADPVCGVMLLEAAHTSDPSFDPATVLFKPIIQVDARPVVNVVAQRRADCARVGAMPVGVTRSGTKPTTDLPSGRTSGRSHCHGSRSASCRSGSRRDRSAETNSTGRPATETATGIEGPDSDRRSQRRESSIFRLWSANLTHCGGYTTRGNGVW
jgi:hypothetical protein